MALGSRVIVTTHYQRVKELAAGSEVFRVAAMEFVDNKPTYRLRMGSVGESYALETARRMQMPESVLTRANLLLDDETKRLLALQQRLEEEIEAARARQVALEAAISELDERDRRIEEQRRQLQIEMDKLKEGKTDDFLADLKARERELELMMRRAQEIMNAAANVTKAERESVIEDVKSAVKQVRLEVEKEIVEQLAEDIATPLVPGEPIEEGTPLIILEKGTLFGTRGVAAQRNKGRGRVVLRVAGVEVKMERHLLGTPLRSGQFGFLMNGADAAAMSAKDKRLMKMLKEELVDPDKLAGPNKKRKEGKIVGKRGASNTVDIRGLSFSDAQTATTAFIRDKCEEGERLGSIIIYINHGNTKDAVEVKTKLRQWLKKYPLVSRMNPAELSDGGDAYTVIEVDLN